MKSCYFEKLLAVHCAPTLAAIKPSCLLCCDRRACSDWQDILEYYRELFAPKGLDFFVVSESADFFALLVYRRHALQMIFSDEKIAAFLSPLGYKRGDSLPILLNHLKERMRGASFPHEIGLFLGYPVADVAGFIENHGQNFKYSGYWKVYGDVEKARCIFNQYRDCCDNYCRSFDCGKAIFDIVQAG
jgi:hypothetical protein